jgi:transposase
MVDGTSVGAHRCAAGAEGGGRRRPAAAAAGSAPSSLHPRCNRRGRPITFALTPGERHEQTTFPELMATGAVRRPGPGRPRLRPRAPVADRGYTGEPVRARLRRRGISAVIPQLATGARPRLTGWRTYRERDVVERLVGRPKEHRRIATRCDKLAASYLAHVRLAAIRMWP